MGSTGTMSNTVILCSERDRFISEVKPALERSYSVYVCKNEDELIPMISDVPPMLVIFDLGADEKRIDQAVSIAICHDQAPMFVLHSDASEEIGKVMVKAGVRGYAADSIGTDLILKGVLDITEGAMWIPRGVMRSMMDELMGRGAADNDLNVDERVGLLTPRELQVAKLVSKGLSNKSVAEQLGLTVRTVKAHLTSSFEKTETRSRLELSLLLRGELLLSPTLREA